MIRPLSREDRMHWRTRAQYKTGETFIQREDRKKTINAGKNEPFESDSKNKVNYMIQFYIELHILITKQRHNHH